MLTQEVFFLPVVLVLGTHFPNHWLHCAALLFFSIVVLLSPIVWDIDVPYESLLDIRRVGLSASGQRLLMLAAVFAGVSQQYNLFISLLSAACVWTAAWIPFGCSAPWSEVLRLGALFGAQAVVTAGPSATIITWAAAIVLAFIIAFCSWVVRRRRLAASEVPIALRHCAEMQKRLCLWGGAAFSPELLRVGADVRSAAQCVLEFEERLPMERLDLAFFAERRQWRTTLVEAPSYSAVIQHLEVLKAAISEPATQILVQQVLARALVRTHGKELGEPLACKIARLAVPPIDVVVPSPLKGWEFGNLDLAILRRHAAKAAAKIPDMIQTRGHGTQVLGRHIP